MPIAVVCVPVYTPLLNSMNCKCGTSCWQSIAVAQLNKADHHTFFGTSVSGIYTVTVVILILILFCISLY